MKVPIAKFKHNKTLRILNFFEKLTEETGKEVQNIIIDFFYISVQKWLSVAMKMNVIIWRKSHHTVGGSKKAFNPI